MKRITIERYQPDKHDTPNGPWQYSGLIEGETDSGDRWIMWLDKEGRPELFWPNREPDGAVVGDAIRLDRRPGQFSGVFECLQVADDADSWDENGPRNEEVISTFPVWHPGLKEGENLPEGQYPPDTMRGIVFAVVPGEGLNTTDRMRKFLAELSEGFGVPSAEQRMAKMREILDSDTPENAVRRLRESLDAVDRATPETKEAVKRIFDHNTTQEVKSLP